MTRQEFQRLCATKGLSVNLVPLSEHHETYCAEDIEIWEVRRMNSDGSSVKLDSKQRCILQTWGEQKELIPIFLDGLELQIQQTPKSGIGGILWPSSVIATR